MKQFLYSIVMILSVSTAWASPEIHQWQTENGTKVLFIEAPELPMLDVRLVFDAGAARDGDVPGVANFVNALIFEGTEKRDAQAIALAFENVGAQVGNSVARDMNWLTLRTLTKEAYLDASISAFNESLIRPKFSAGAIDRIRGQIQTSLKAREQSPGDLVDDLFMATLYAGHPYGSPTNGTNASVEAMNRDSIVTFYNEYFVAKNATLALIGAVSKHKAKQIASRLMAGLPAGKAAGALPAAPVLGEQVVRRDFASSQSHIQIGLPAVKRGNPDFWSLYVGNQTLGGNGLVSLLSKEVREKRGLAYSAGSYFAQMRVAGPFQMSAQTRAEAADETLAVMKSVLADFIENGPTDDQLKHAKSNLVDGFPMRLDSNGKMLGYLAMMGFYDLPVDYLANWRDNVARVTRDDVQAAFSKYVDLNKLQTVMVGPVVDGKSQK